MVSKALQATAEELGFTYVEKAGSDKSYLYGVYGGYLITLTDAGNSKTAFINYYLSLPDEVEESVPLLDISEAFKSASAGYAVTDYDVRVDGIAYTVNCKVEEFFSLLDSMIEILGEKELRGVTNCSCCGNSIGKRFPKKLTQANRNYLLCEHCALDKLENDAKDVPEAQSLPKKTVLGLLGAIVGGLVGMLLYFLVYLFLSPMFTDSAFEIRYIFSLFGFLTAFLAYKGFTLLSKRPCVSAAVCISSVTLVATVLGQYFGSFAGYAKVQGFTLAQAAKIPSMWLIHLRSTLDTAIDYKDSVLNLYNIAPMFYKLLGFSLLFALIGSILFMMGFFDKAKAKKEPTEVETLRISAPEKNAE